jgi:hypothetical protein
MTSFQKFPFSAPKPLEIEAKPVSEDRNNKTYAGVSLISGRHNPYYTTSAGNPTPTILQMAIRVRNPLFQAQFRHGRRAQEAKEGKGVGLFPLKEGWGRVLMSEFGTGVKEAR